MKLVYIKSKNPVKQGDRHVLKGNVHIVTGFLEPHKPSSTGRIHLNEYYEHNKSRIVEYFPSVIGAEWIEREDQ